MIISISYCVNTQYNLYDKNFITIYAEQVLEKFEIRRLSARDYGDLSYRLELSHREQCVAH